MVQEFVLTGRWRQARKNGHFFIGSQVICLSERVIV